MAYLVSHLPKDRFRFSLVSPGGATRQLFSRYGVAQSFNLPLRRFKRTWNPLALVRMILQWFYGSFCLLMRLRSMGADVIHANGFHSMLYVLLARFVLRIPVIWHVRDFCRSKFAAFICAHMADRMLVPSIALANRLPSHRSKTFHLPNPLLPAAIEGTGEIAGKKFCGCAESLLLDGKPSFNIGFVGQLIPRKGIHLLLQAFSLVLEKRSDAALYVIGDDPFSQKSPYIQSLRDCVRADVLLSERVHFLGYMASVSSILSWLDVLVIPSLEEVFGRVALEAMYFGCPVVAADTGGLAEIVKDRQNGLLFKNGDHLALADRIVQLAQDRGLREEIIEGGRRTANDYNCAIEDVAREMEDAYGRLLDEDRAKSPTQAD